MFVDGLTTENIDAYLRHDDIPLVHVEPIGKIEHGAGFELHTGDLGKKEEMQISELPSEDVMQAIKRDNPMLYDILQSADALDESSRIDAVPKPSKLLPPTFQPLPDILPVWPPPSRPASPIVEATAVPIDRSGWPQNKIDVNGFDDMSARFMWLFAEKQGAGFIQSTCTSFTVYNTITMCSKDGEHFRLFLLDDIRSKFRGKIVKLQTKAPVRQNTGHYPIVIEPPRKRKSYAQHA